MMFCGCPVFRRHYFAALYDLRLRYWETCTVDGWWEQLWRAAEVLNFAQVDPKGIRQHTERFFEEHFRDQLSGVVRL